MKFAPGIIHLAGPPAAGKTTIARVLEKRLADLGYPSELLDGDEMRRKFFCELGFGRDAREANAERTFELATMLARHHVTALVSLITPYESSRSRIRDMIRERNVRYYLVHVHAPYEVLAARDPKGLYAKYARGEIKGLTGVDDPFEPFLEPKADLFIDTTTHSVDDCARQIFEGFVNLPHAVATVEIAVDVGRDFEVVFPADGIDTLEAK